MGQPRRGNRGESVCVGEHLPRPRARCAVRDRIRVICAGTDLSSERAGEYRPKWFTEVRCGVEKGRPVEITKDTRVAAILEEYGDIADVMEVFGVKRVGRYSLRMLAAKAVTVEWAARLHRVPLNEFLEILDRAIGTKNDQQEGKR